MGSTIIKRVVGRRLGAQERSVLMVREHSSPESMNPQTFYDRGYVFFEANEV
ncbi:MAG: hypothetical protein LBF72_02610 [Holosporales bacterium]|nr:hypothetical protein [Holosporales bacterium]